MIRFKSYNDEYRELLSFLTDNWEMEKPYAQAFMDTYKRNIGRMFAACRKKKSRTTSYNKLGVNGRCDDGFRSRRSNFCARLAYMTDLRRGKHVGTMIEMAI